MFTLTASPPKIVTFDEIMKATAGVSNMMLAHNIVTSEQFRFEKREPPDERSLSIMSALNKAKYKILFVADVKLLYFAR